MHAKRLKQHRAENGCYFVIKANGGGVKVFFSEAFLAINLNYAP